jgi:hypothetical protein
MIILRDYWTESNPADRMKPRFPGGMDGFGQGESSLFIGPDGGDE